VDERRSNARNAAALVAKHGGPKGLVVIGDIYSNPELLSPEGSK
jgi:hypothetical protein